MQTYFSAADNPYKKCKWIWIRKLTSKTILNLFLNLTLKNFLQKHNVETVWLKLNTTVNTNNKHYTIPKNYAFKTSMQTTWLPLMASQICPSESLLPLSTLPRQGMPEITTTAFSICTTTHVSLTTVKKIIIQYSLPLTVKENQLITTCMLRNSLQKFILQ